jgi:TPR repeat protein
MKRWKAIVFASLLLMVGMCAWAQDTEMFEKAQAGDSAAQFELSIYYLNQKDYSNFIYWVQKSADSGNTDAKAEVAEMVKKAQAGDSAAQFELSRYYGNKKDYPKMTYWVQKSADSGNTDAEEDLASFYIRGFGGKPRDGQKAKYWLMKAAKGGNLWAQCTLPAFLGDSQEAIYWQRRAAEGGFSPCQLDLGKRYQSGHGVPKDYEKAKYWLQKAAVPHGGYDMSITAKEALAQLEGENGPLQCNSLDQVVQIDDAMPSGPGHCAGEADFWFTNISAQAIDCAIMFHKNGRFDRTSILSFTLSPGEKSGGTGKISTCGADSGQMQYQCFAHGQNAAANSCTAQIQWHQ